MRSVRNAAAAAMGLAIFPFLAGEAYAETSQWDHNGSLMQLEAKDKKTRLIYLEPRESLSAAGAKNGTVLFDGEEKKDGRLAGYAKLFRKGCDPVDYFVEGPYDKAKGEILLQGQAPIYSGNGCKITGYTDDGSASSLKFTLQNAPDQYVSNAPDAGQDRTARRPSYLPPLNQDQTAEEPTDRDQRSAEKKRTYDRYRRPANPVRPPDDRNVDREREREPERDYAQRDRGDSESRYDGAYNYGSRFRYDPYDDDVDDDDEYDEPAYVPYRPRWRRFYSY